MTPFDRSDRPEGAAMRRSPFTISWAWRLSAALTAVSLAAIFMAGCEVAKPELPSFTTRTSFQSTTSGRSTSVTTWRWI